MLYISIIDEVARILYLRICGFPKDRKNVFAARATMMSIEIGPCQDMAPKIPIITMKREVDI